MGAATLSCDPPPQAAAYRSRAAELWRLTGDDVIVGRLLEVGLPRVPVEPVQLADLRPPHIARRSVVAAHYRGAGGNKVSW